VLRAAAETETAQENIRGWLKPEKGDPGFQLMAEEEISAVIYFFIFISTACIIKFPIYLFSNLFLSFKYRVRQGKLMVFKLVLI
jgi:hypothetical protein